MSLKRQAKVIHGGSVQRAKLYQKEQETLSLTGTRAEANLQGYEIFQRLSVGIHRLFE